MTTTTSDSSKPAGRPVERVNLNRLWWAGPLTIAAATVVNVLIQQLSAAFIQPDPRFLPLTLFPPIIFTVLGVLGAVIVFALVARRGEHPVTRFKQIAFIVLLVSLVPDVLLMITRFNPGTTVLNVLVLMLMHVVAWAFSVTLLPRLTRV